MLRIGKKKIVKSLNMFESQLTDAILVVFLPFFLIDVCFGANGFVQSVAPSPQHARYGDVPMEWVLFIAAGAFAVAGVLVLALALDRSRKRKRNARSDDEEEEEEEAPSWGIDNVRDISFEKLLKTEQLHVIAQYCTAGTKKKIQFSVVEGQNGAPDRFVCRMAKGALPGAVMNDKKLKKTDKLIVEYLARTKQKNKKDKVEAKRSNLVPLGRDSHHASIPGMKVFPIQIVVTKDDGEHISDRVFEKTCAWTRENTIWAVGCMEFAGTKGNQEHGHYQGICEMRMTKDSAAALSVVRERLREYLGDDGLDVQICIKGLNTRKSGKRKTTTQTLGGSIGYVFKEQGHDNFKCDVFNVHPDVIQSAIFEHRSFTQVIKDFFFF